MDRVKGPEILDVKHIGFTQPDVHTTNNNIDIFELGGLPEEVLQVEFQFDAGRKRQSLSLQAGMALEMLLEGADGRSGADIMNELDGYGAYVDTSTELDRSTLTVFCMNRGFDKVWI